MVRQLTIRLYDGCEVVMRACGPEEAAPFDGLGKLLRLPVGEGTASAGDAEFVLPDALPPDRQTVRDLLLTEIAYDAAWRRTLIAGWKKPPRHPVYYRNSLWRKLLIYAAMNASLRGADASLVHCAALETDRGAVLLFGESGMGKSTAFGRWRAAGGKGFSDDMTLLDFSGRDGIYVRRMPTWSACEAGLNKWDYPAGEELPLAGVFALGRSSTGRDEIVELSPAQFFAQCYRSVFYWSLFRAKDLPRVLQERLAAQIRRRTERIAEMFPPRALLTVPDGSPVELIEESI